MAAHIAASDIEDPIDAIKAAVLSTEIGDTIALQDRNHHEHHWREIYLCRMEHDKWRLSDVNHFDLDENEDGCPFSGFSTESILADIGMHFYQIFMQLWMCRPTYMRLSEQKGAALMNRIRKMRCLRIVDRHRCGGGSLNGMRQVRVRCFRTV